MNALLIFFRRKKIANQIKNNNMKKTLELDDNTARKLYPTAAPEFKELLEQNFGKDFFRDKITDRITSYESVCDYLRVSSSDCSIKVEVEGFSCEEIKVAKNLVKKMRIAKVLNEGWFPKRVEQRWYVWFDVSSGFVFYNAFYDGSYAYATSASRLCFKTEELALHYAKHFSDVEENIVLG